MIPDIDEDWVEMCADYTNDILGGNADMVAETIMEMPSHAQAMRTVAAIFERLYHEGRLKSERLSPSQVFAKALFHVAGYDKYAGVHI